MARRFLFGPFKLGFDRREPRRTRNAGVANNARDLAALHDVLKRI